MIQKYAKYVKGNVATFLQIIGEEVIVPNSLDLFEGQTCPIIDMEEQYGKFVGTLEQSEMPIRNQCHILKDKWTIIQIKEETK